MLSALDPFGRFGHPEEVVDQSAFTDSLVGP
jgi:hypothetical protein